IVILPEQDHDAALKLGQRLCHAINNHDFTLAKPLSISIGGTTVKGSDYSFNSLVSKADKALYSVKQSGKNGVKMYSGLF
ncbi:MAG TPA: diguanylate cyclase, partial [Sulfuricurvum sp.]|nr:diguanylate cyclase [Sulfuricurvum sp.]